jgi:transcriptional regulator with XRE-family HTH domain
MNAKQCRMARTGLGLSAHELGTEAGLTRLTVARFESGRAISDESREAIEKALHDAGAKFSRQAGRIGVTVPE